MHLVQQPYPFHYQLRVLHKFALLAFAIIFLFLWLFEPFHVNPAEQRLNYWLICLVHASVPSLIFYCYFLLFNLLVSEQGADNWTVGKELAHLAVLLFLFGLASFLVRDVLYTNSDNWSWHYFFEELKNTFLGGVLISSLLILLNFYRLYTATQKQASQLNTHLPEPKEPEQQSIAIRTQVKADDFDLRIDAFLFARADGNYVEIFSQTPHGIKKELKRITLAKLENQVGNIALLIRCHRAYLINTNNIQRITGNAQGYQVSFVGTSEQALVSRNKMQAFNALMH